MAQSWVPGGGRIPSRFAEESFREIRCTIFLMVSNPILEYLGSKQHCGYKLSDETCVITTPFADDFNVITTNARSHQRIIRNVEEFTSSLNLVLEPTKSKSLLLCHGQSKSVDFRISGQTITSLKDIPEKFLGAQITFHGKQSEIFDHTEGGRKLFLDNIQGTLIRPE